MRRVLTVVGMMMAAVAMAQDGGYRAPLDGVLRLSGNFGEVRSNHFHAGLDLKTDGAEGKAVHVIADGHIVRVNVSPTGYGKALYVEHADGKTSVYAHLREFGAEVAAYVKQQQYAEEKFAVDLTIPKGKFVVKRGDVIAKSGNGGGSGGPHLHFEIRDTESQAPLNPLDHGFKVADDNAPEMQRLWIYNHAKNGHVDGLTHERAFDLERKGNAYTIKGKEVVEAAGTLSFGIAALDHFSDSDNACGIHTMTVSVDGKIIHHHKLDKMPFDKKRMVNAHIDFDKRQRSREVVHRSYIAPLNTLDIYKKVAERGTMHLAAGQRKEVRAMLTDHAGNAATLIFTLEGQTRTGTTVEQQHRVTDMFMPDRDNHFSNPDIRITVPKGCLYDTLAFRHEAKPRCEDCYSDVHSIHDMYTPMEDYMTVGLRIHPFKGKDTGKLLIVSFDEKGKPVAEGGTVAGQWVSTRTRSFGDYAVMKDSLAPELRPKNFRDQTETARFDTLIFHLRDELSGIATYRGTLNGKWVLLEHDPKNNILFYVKDARWNKGQNTLRISTNDKVGNTKELSVTVW